MAKTTGEAAVDEAAATITKADHDAAVTAAREEGRKAGHAAGKAEGISEVAAGAKSAADARAEGLAVGRTEGATAERERILGIEQAALPGHDALVAKLKADPTVSIGEAALQINAAERGLRTAAGKAIANVEDATRGVRADASSDHRGATPEGGSKAATPEGWKAEYAASADLQRQFPSEASYVSYRKADAAGRVHILDRKRA